MYAVNNLEVVKRKKIIKKHKHYFLFMIVKNHQNQFYIVNFNFVETLKNVNLKALGEDNQNQN